MYVCIRVCFFVVMEQKEEGQCRLRKEIKSDMEQWKQRESETIQERENILIIQNNQEVSFQLCGSFISCLTGN